MFFNQTLALSESCLLVHIKNSHKNCIKSINQLITNYCLYIIIYIIKVGFIIWPCNFTILYNFGWPMAMAILHANVQQV